MHPINSAIDTKLPPSSPNIHPQITKSPHSLLFQPFSPSSSETSSSSSTNLSPMSMQQAAGTTIRHCSICCCPSNGFYFGVLSCRACASFFRRSALEKRQYECRRGGQCEIRAEGMRNSCRACRLRTCIEAGMSIDSTTISSSTTTNEHSSTDINSINQSISATIQTMNSAANTMIPNSSTEILHAPGTSISHLNSSAKLSMDMSFDLCIPNILQMAQSLRNFQNGHKALVNVLIGKLDLSPDCKFEFRPITLEEHINLDRGQITMMLNLLREYFPPLDGLNNKTKVAILKCFHLQLCQIRNAEYAIQTFPGMEKLDKHLMHPGCGIDRNNLAHFFSTTESPEEHIRLCIPLLDRITAFVMNHYRPLAINQMEFAALALLLLYNNVDRFLTLAPEYMAQRNVIYTELHALLTQQFSGDSSKIAVRFGQLMTLMLDLVNLTYEMEELFTILKIFLPPIASTDVWEDLLNAKSKESIICEEKTSTTTITAKEEKNIAKLIGNKNTNQQKNTGGGIEKCEAENNIVDILGQ